MCSTRYARQAENVRQVSAYERSIYQSRMKESRSARTCRPLLARVCTYVCTYVRNKRDLTRPRRRATCGKVSPSPELCCSRKKGVTRSGRAAHRSPHYLGEALLNIQNAPNAEEARHAHVQRCRRRCGPMREDEKRGHATRASRMRR